MGTGKTVVLAEYYEIQESDCRAMRAPPVVIKTRSTLGKLVVNTTTGQAGNIGQVPARPGAGDARALPCGRGAGARHLRLGDFLPGARLGTRSVHGSATLTRQPTDR